jgi:hypothetical protein
VRLDSAVIDRLIREMTPRAYLRVTPLKYAGTPLGLGFGETRFASPSRAFRVLYLGRSLTTAVAETLVRDRFVGRRRRLLALDEIAAWGVTEVSGTERLCLLDLTGSGLVQLGVPTNAVRGKAHGQGRRFSEALHALAPGVDGILYPSRLTNGASMAIYERAVSKLRSSPVSPLIDQPTLVPALRALNIMILAK